jgi:hypothetical protein
MRSVAISLAAYALTLTASAIGSAQPAATINNAVAAAKARQESIKTLDVKYIRKEMLRTGGVSEFQSRGLKPDHPVPPNDLTLESENRLLIDGMKYRFENNHPGWHMPGGELRRRSAVTLFDGDHKRSFYPTGAGGITGPRGVIAKVNSHPELRQFLLIPITLTFRGLEPAYAPYTINHLKPIGITLPIEGSPCQEYRALIGDNVAISLWLDSKKANVVRRVTEQRQNLEAHQCDIYYRLDDRWGWLPVTWVYNRYAPGGRLAATNQVTVTAMQINGSYSAGEFELEFPADSRVYDNRKSKQYEVQPDGTMRERVRSKTNERLGETVYQLGDSWYRRNKWYFFTLGALGTCIVAWYLLRRKRALVA